MILRVFLTYISILVGCVVFAQERQQLMDSLIQETQVSADSHIRAAAHSRLAWLYLNSDFVRAERHLDSSKIMYTQLRDTSGLAMLDYKYAVLNRLLGNYQLAHEYIDSYIAYAETSKDSAKLANSAYQKGVIYSLQVDYESSLKAYLKTLELYEGLKDSVGMGFTLNSIGIVYKNLKKYDEAIASFEQAAGIHEVMDDKANLANVYNGLGGVYAELHKDEEALTYFHKTLAIDEQIGNDWGMAKVCNNIALVYLENDHPSKALEYLNSALEIQESKDFRVDMIETLTQLSLAYLKLGNYAESEAYLNRINGADIPSIKEQKAYHFQAYQLYEAMGQPRRALEHYQAYSRYKDSIFNEANLKNINTLQIQYETEKKDKSILKQQLALQQQAVELQDKNRKIFYISAVGLLLLVLALASWFVFQQKQKRKTQELIALKREYQIKSLESLIEGEEKERLRIAKELHDGVNGDLSAIKHKLSSLLEMNNKVIGEAIAMIDSSCEQVRAISHNLVPPSLENFNLVEATENYCANLNAMSKEQISFQHLGDELELSKKAEVNAFRIIQELVSNARKHAQAHEINVQISGRDGLIQITVEDDGKGFDKNDHDDQGIGLSNIKSRVDYLNAHMDVISNSNGTSYTIDIDLNKPNDN